MKALLGTAPALIMEQSRGWAELIRFFFQHMRRSGHCSSHTGVTDRDSWPCARRTYNEHIIAGTLSVLSGRKGGVVRGTAMTWGVGESFLVEVRPATP